MKDNLASGLLNFVIGLTSGKKKSASINGANGYSAEDTGFFVEKKRGESTHFDWLAKWSEYRIFANRKKLRVLSAIFSVIFVFSSLLGYMLIESTSADPNGVVAGVFEANPDAPAGVVKGEKITDASSTVAVADNVTMASQNFMIKQMHFGGDLAVISTTDDPSPLEVRDVKSEVLVARNRGKEENKLVISWKTNKLALSSIEYGKVGNSDPIKIKEDTYGFNHSAIISGLAQGTAYNYTISVKDKWGNDNQPTHFAAYSGTRTISVFELIAKTLADLFGWAGGSK